MTTEEVIAQLDAMERSLETFRLKLKTLRNDLVESLDKKLNDDVE